MTKASSGTSSSRSRARSPSASKPARARKSRASAPPVEAAPARVIAIANQKGGVGKSTTAVSLGAALAELGHRVLVVDLDPQGNASTGLGIRHESRDISVYDVLVGDAPLQDAVVPTQVERLDAVPSTIDLAGAEVELVSQFSREGRLKRALEDARRLSYDFILLDCPPSLGLLTINAMTAAEELIVPIQCEYYALEGLGQLLRNVSLVQQNINPGLRLSGIVMTMFDSRTKLSEQVVAEVQRFFGELVYDVIIPRTVRLSEAPGFGQPITVYDPRSKGAETYRQLAREVASRPLPESALPSLQDLPTVVIRPPQPEIASRAKPPHAAPEPLEEAPPPTVHELIAEAQAADSDAAEDELEVEAIQADVTEAVASAAAGLEAEEEGSLGDGMAASHDDLEDIWEETADEPRIRPPRRPAAPGTLPERRVVLIDDDADIEASTEPLVQTPVGTPAPGDGSQEAVAPIGATLEDESEGRRRRWRLFRKGGDE